MAPGTALLVSCALAAPAAGADGSGQAPYETESLPPRRDLFGKREPVRKHAEPAERGGRTWGTVVFSDGRRVEGRLSVTLDGSLVFFDTETEEWREVPLTELARADARPRVEKLDREWRWKEAGCDEKVYTGRARPLRWLDHDVRLKDGSGFSGHIKGTVIYVETAADPPAGGEPRDGDGPGKGGEKSGGKSVEKTRAASGPRRSLRPEKRERYFLRQYDRGSWGETLESLVYVRSIVMHEPGEGPPAPPVRDGAATLDVKR